MRAALTGIAAAPVVVLAAALVAGAAAMAAAVAPADVAYVEIGIPESLTGAPGDAAKGREVFADRKLGNCLACHANAELSEQSFHGEVGPPLDGVGDRWDEATLRGILVNAKHVFGDQTIMPAFYTLETGERVAEKFQGKTILTAEQVEDVVAYLMTLKE